MALSVNQLGSTTPVRDLATLRAASRQAVQEYLDLKDRFASSDPKQRPSGSEYDRLRERLKQLPHEYAAALPAYALSRCPFCETPLHGAFDPWGFDGFWWVPSMRGGIGQPQGCEHFRVLLGAVWLQDKPPIAGPYEAMLGPDVPYVIPRLMEMPTMTMVVHSIAMEPGYVALPLAYFSKDVPAPGSLTQGWIEKTYSFLDANGQHAWSVRNDPWNFNLAPWIASGQVRWTVPDNPDAQLVPKSEKACPYGNPAPVALPQIAENNTLGVTGLPDNEIVEPFE